MFKYKTVKRKVPWCEICNHEIYGNGSIATPYFCKCGEYEFVYSKDCVGGEYKLIKK